MFKWDNNIFFEKSTNLRPCLRPLWSVLLTLLALFSSIGLLPLVFNQPKSFFSRFTFPIDHTAVVAVVALVTVEVSGLFAHDSEIVGKGGGGGGGRRGQQTSCRR